MKIKHICFIVPNYPTKQDPTYTFVKQLVETIADNNIKCTVIATQSLTKKIIRQNKSRPFNWQDESPDGNKINIYQPSVVSFSNLKLFERSLSAYVSKKSIIDTFEKTGIKPDIIYAHFWHSGVIAGEIGNKLNIPVFVATGESKIWVNKLFAKKDIYENLKNIAGVISVSSKNKEESLNLGLTTSQKIKIIPNSVNLNKFYKMDKDKVREKLGYRKEDFIVSFTGAFSNRKGVLRLSKALDNLDNVKSIFIGSGELNPDNKNILFKGRLPHEEIVKYLNASDVFVLPTLAEGCPNATIEAMACGLPIISSDLSFNDEILDKTNSSRIDPNSIEEITKAIRYLKNNPESRKNMSKASLHKSKSLTIENRAKKIICFIESMADKPIKSRE